MLYQFRAPLFRQWNFQKIHGYLSDNPGLAKHFKDCHATREKILGTLREAYTKQCGGVRGKVQSNKVVDFRADTLIALLEEYMPMLETLIAFVEDQLEGKLKGLETVWTSVLTNSWEAKALSANLKHEKMQVYFLYGQAIYSQAAKAHREHRTEIQTEEMKERRGSGDDLTVLKELITQLKRAAGIWEWISKFESKCYPINCKNHTPEVFQDIPKALSWMALANAQELMVQVAVMTGKSNKLVAKLSEGVSVWLLEALQLAKKELGTQASILSHDIVVYLDRRSKMYHGVALKYQSKVKLEEEKYGERVAVLDVAVRCLSGLKITPLKVKRKLQPLSLTLLTLSSSIKDQLQACKALYQEAKSDNDQVYHYKVPPTSTHETVDHVKFIKPTEYTPPEPIVLLLSSEMDKLTINNPSEEQDEELKIAIAMSLNANKPENEKSEEEVKVDAEDSPKDPNAPTATTVSYV